MREENLFLREENAQLKSRVAELESLLEMREVGTWKKASSSSSSSSSSTGAIMETLIEDEEESAVYEERKDIMLSEDEVEIEIAAEEMAPQLGTEMIVDADLSFRSAAESQAEDERRTSRKRSLELYQEEENKQRVSIGGDDTTATEKEKEKMNFSLSDSMLEIGLFDLANSSTIVASVEEEEVVPAQVIQNKRRRGSYIPQPHRPRVAFEERENLDPQIINSLSTAPLVKKPTQRRESLAAVSAMLGSIESQNGQDASIPIAPPPSSSSRSLRSKGLAAMTSLGNMIIPKSNSSTRSSRRNSVQPQPATEVWRDM